MEENKKESLLQKFKKIVEGKNKNKRKTVHGKSSFKEYYDTINNIE